jgi:TetR/AcrR family transcriptional regulator, cholesterol catabolism regulator
MLKNNSRKQEIVGVSQNLFQEKGYQATSVRDIAKALEMEPASLYSHLETKEDILEEICFGMAEKFLSAVDEVNDIYFDAELKVKMAVENHVKILTDNLDAAVVFIREWRNLSEPKKSAFVEKRKQYEQGIREIVQTGIDELKFNEVDKGFAALTILSSVNWIVEWYSSDGKLSPMEIAEQLSRFILTGLRKENL